VRVQAVRGAIRVAENSAEAIRAAAARLTAELLARNAIEPARVVSLVFSVTRDLTLANPAEAARSLGLTEVPLFCLQEAELEGSMPQVIRALLTFSGGARPLPVYLDGAEALRPDLFPPQPGGGRA
jgi:chorismate mutase